MSSFLHDVVVPGDELEVRGPIGGWFVWRGDTPAVLIGGGSGVVPLMAMLRLARRNRRPDLVDLIVSTRAPEDLYFASELDGPNTTVLYTLPSPRGVAPTTGSAHRARPATVEHNGASTVSVCGSSGFSDAATTSLAKLGVQPDRIRGQPFGPSG